MWKKITEHGINTCMNLDMLYITATQASTKFSPAFLNFGRHPEQPKSLRREKERYVKIQKIDEKVWIERLKQLDKLRDLVFETV